MQCRYCELWELKSGDTFCSFCGSLLERFTVTASKSVLYYQDGEEAIITIENDGDSLQEISLIKPAASWLQVDSEIIQPKAITLKPGEKKQITLRLEKPPQLEILPPPFVMKFFPLTNKRVNLELEFSFKFPSEIKTEGSFENISVSKDKKIEHFIMAVKNIGDDPILVNSIAWKNPDSKPEGITLSSSQTPHQITKGRPFAIKLELDYNKLRVQRINKHNNSLVLSFPDNEMEIPASLNMKMPEIQLVDQKEDNKISSIEVEAFQEKSILKKYVLKNTGDAEADIRFDFVQKVKHVNPGSNDKISWQSDDSVKKYISFNPPFQHKQLSANSQIEFGIIFDFKKFASELKGSEKEKSHNTTLQFVYDYSQDSDFFEVPVLIKYRKPEDSFEYIGIDFGTTNSVVAIFENNRVLPVKEAGSDKDLIPSVIYFETPEVFDIGTEAYQKAQMDYDNAAFSIKRILGNDYKRRIRGREMEPTDIAACIMKSLKEKAEEHLTTKTGRPQRIKSAIITVPANFYDAQIKAVMEAYEKAGFEVPGGDAHVILDEPTAAGYYYIRKLYAQGDFKELKQGEKKHFLIFDFGGGTLDITIAVLEKNMDGQSFFKIKSNRGENSLGGENLDFIIFEYTILEQGLKNVKSTGDILKIKNLYVKEPYNKLRKEFKKYFDQDIEFSSFRDTRFLLKKQAEEIKIGLSENQEIKERFRDTIFWDLNEHGKLKQSSTSKSIEISVSRALYERYCEATKREIDKIIEKALKAANVTVEDIDYVVHTGRSSLNLWIQELLKKKFPSDKVKHILENDELKMCVAKGAAYWGRALGGVRDGTDDIEIGEDGRRFPLPHSYGTEISRFANFFYDEIIPAGTLFPMDKPKIKIYDKSKLPKGGLLRLRFYQNEGTDIQIDGNPEIRMVGRVDVKLIPTDVECKIEIMVNANRKLKIIANNEEADIIPEQIETFQEWW